MPNNALIKKITARRVWDSRGHPTIEAEVQLRDDSIGRAIAPAGASRGLHEAVDLRDGNAALGGLDVSQACAGIREIIEPGLAGLSAHDQHAVDARLVELDGTEHKSRLGANATIAVSMAVAHAAAAARSIPLWRHLAGDKAPRLPMPLVQLFGGGAHAAGRIDVQDIMIVPVGANSFEEAILKVSEVYHAAGRIMREDGLLRGVADEGGWWPEFASNHHALTQAVRAIERAGLVPGDDIGLALDVAASHFWNGERYQMTADERSLDAEELTRTLADWCEAFPIISLEDPLHEEDETGLRELTAAIGDKVQIVGDDYLVTSRERVIRAAGASACNAALIKPNQVGTLTETLAAFEAARDSGWRTIISARSGESEDVTIVHLAVGWNADQLKVGSFSRSERMAKWNEAIRIEQALGRAGTFAGRTSVGGIAPKRTTG